MSEDGKYIFFPDKTDDENYGTNCFDLYYKEAAKPEVQAVLIDSDISCYTVNASSTLITYLKLQEDGGGILYQYKIGEGSRDKIASDVLRFATSSDGRKIVYLDLERSVYIKYADNEKEKIAGEGSFVEYVTEDFTTVYYIEDESLYKWVEGEDLVKIDSDVCDTVKIYETGEIYYATKGRIPLINYVIDDMKDNTSMELNEFRDYLAEEPLEQYSLCFYNGSEKTVISDTFNYGSYNCVCASETPVIFYRSFNQSFLEKVNLSELGEGESVYFIQEIVKAVAFPSSDVFIAVKGNSTKIQQEEATNFVLNNSGTTAYYIDNIPEGQDYGTLYRIDISNGVVGRPEVYDSEVYARNMSDTGFLSDSVFVYFKNVNELYINKNEVDQTVSRVIRFRDNGIAYYLTHFKDKVGLKKYDGEETIWITDNLDDFCFTFDGSRALYLRDYDNENYEGGELYEWSDGKTRKIDDDVAYIIENFSIKYKGYYYSLYL